MITAFRVRNLRAIEDSGVIEFKKINVLVGRNSSGKSTILRVLPLLRQSVEQPTKGPLLWYGRLVDFGGFKDAARNGDTKRGICLEFKMRVNVRRGMVGRYPFAVKNEFLTRSNIVVNVSIMLGRSEDDKVGNIRELKISAGEDHAVIKFAPDGDVSSVSVMDEVVKLGENSEWAVSPGVVLPILAVMYKEHYVDSDGDVDYDWDELDNPFADEIVKALAKVAHGNTSDDRLGLIASKLIYSGGRSFFKHAMDLVSSVPSMHARLDFLGPEAVEVSKLRRAVFLNWIVYVIKAIDEDLSLFARSVSYLEPIRASAERYYREQDLAVDEIDSRGTNTAMFLGSLSDKAMRNLQVWVQQHFGFVVHVESGTGHAQIKISASGQEPRNMADLGFGYSQLLPIILQLWRLTRMSPMRSAIVAIEQPELHLHPHYQAMLADVVVATTAATRQVNRARIVIETHSDHFVNRLGLLVSQGVINAEDVQVIVVSEDEWGSSTAASVSFDKEGVLGDNWPVGFFTPEAR